MCGGRWNGNVLKNLCCLLSVVEEIEILCYDIDQDIAKRQLKIILSIHTKKDIS